MDQVKEELQEQRERYEGTVTEIVHRTETNGYTVLRFLPTGESDPFTAVGFVPFAEKGESLCVEGKWEMHQRFGRQFTIESYEQQLPVGAAGMLSYLSSGAVKGIGSATAKKLVDAFGDETFEVLEKNPEFLVQINGISPKKAAEIGANFAAQFGMRRAMMFCAQYFGSATSAKIYKEFGSGTEEIIRKNPFILCERIDGIGFPGADKVAADLGIEQNAPARIEAAIVHLLNGVAAEQGHCYLPMEKLTGMAANLLKIDEEHIDEAYSRMLENGKIIRVKSGKRKFIYLTRYFEAERFIAEKLISTQENAPSLPNEDVTSEIAMVEQESGLTYDKMQEKAIFAAMTSGVLILTGGPGTGKTTVIKALIRIFGHLGCRIALAAPTGRAAKRMSEATGEEAKTIHRLLEAEFDGSGSTVFRRNGKDLLDEDVFIIDEVSMVDTLLMDALLRAVKRGARMIFIGDPDQLPSVGAGNVLQDMIDSEMLTTVTLKTIFRQAEESLIVTNAHAVNNGEYPTLNVSDNDFFFTRRSDEKSVAETVADLCQRRLPKFFGAGNVPAIQVITPTRLGVLGTEHLNGRLQAALNPPSPQKKETSFRGKIFREGDKIMQTKNDYEIAWQHGRTEGKGVFNGDIGRILRILQSDRKIEVDFDGKIASYDFSALEELDHAYAVTVHKSQGSEYPVVILPIFPTIPAPLMTRDLLYTAITRAQKMVIVVGNEEAVRLMVNNDRRPKRNTGLRAYLRLAIKPGGSDKR